MIHACIEICVTVMPLTRTEFVCLPLVAPGAQMESAHSAVVPPRPLQLFWYATDTAVSSG